MIETELNLGNPAARESILKYYIEDHKEFFNQYDVILIDTNPSMGPINQNAFNASDSVVLVSDVDDNSRIGIQLFMYLWGKICRDLRREDNIKALILNRADIRTNLTGNIWDFFSNEEDLSNILVKPAVKEKIAFRKAALERKPISLYKDGKESAEEIKQLIAALEERGVF